MLLIWAVAAGAVSVGWSGYVVGLIEHTFHMDIPDLLTRGPFDGGVVNLPPADHDPNGPNKHRLRSCGVPGPGVEVRIVDNDTGEIIAKANDELTEVLLKKLQNLLKPVNSLIKQN